MVRIVFNHHFYVGFILNAARDCAIARGLLFKVKGYGQGE